MTRLIRGPWIVAAAVLASLAVAGCGKSEPAGSADAPDPGSVVPAAADMAPMPGAPAGAAPGANVAPTAASTETAEGTVRAFFEGLQKHEPQVLWDLMPASYQRDVNEAVHTFAEKMDPEVWNRGMAVARRTVKLLKDRKGLIEQAIQQSPLGGMGPGAEAINLDELGWDGLLDMLATLLDDLAELDRLKTADIGNFLGGTVAELMRQSAALSAAAPGDPLATQLGQLGETKVETLSSGPTTRLRITSPKPDLSLAFGDLPEEIKAQFEAQMEAGRVQEVEFVQVEGKWVPKETADAWEGQMAELRVQLQELPAMLAVMRGPILAGFDQADQVLETLEQAQTADELTAAVMEQILPLLMQLGGGGPVGPLGPGGPRGNDAVVVVIKGTMDDGATVRRLQASLEELSDNPSLAFAFPTPSDDGTEFEVAPVGDVEAFAEKIDFGRVVDVDAVGRRITVELSAGDE